MIPTRLPSLLVAICCAHVAAKPAVAMCLAVVAPSLAEQSAKVADERMQAFGSLRTPVCAAYELRQLAYRIPAAGAGAPLLRKQLEDLGSRRAAGLAAATSLFAALERAAPAPGGQDPGGQDPGAQDPSGRMRLVERTDRRWSVAYSEALYREVEVTKPLGLFPARIQTDDARISWNRDGNQLDVVLGTRGTQKRDLARLLAPFPLGAESLPGLQRWQWRDERLKIDGRRMRVARGHPPGYEDRTWELCFAPGDALPLRFSSHSPKRWSVTWFAGSAKAQGGITVPTVIMSVSQDPKGYRAERFELAKFTDARPSPADLTITVPASVKSFVFENGRTRMLGRDRTRWPELVRAHVRFEQ